MNHEMLNNLTREELIEQVKKRDEKIEGLLKELQKIKKQRNELKADVKKLTVPNAVIVDHKVQKK